MKVADIPSCVPRRLDKQPLPSNATQMLEDLLSPSKGGRPGMNTAKAVRKRVTRLTPPGYASRVAALLTAIIAEVNSSHQLDLSPLTLQDVLAQSEEGRQLLNSAKVSVENRVLAESAILVCQKAGRACKSAVLGVLATANTQGSIPTWLLVENHITLTFFSIQPTRTKLQGRKVPRKMDRLAYTSSEN
jgi:hypothetical protein